MPERARTTTTFITTAYQIGSILEFFNRIRPLQTLGLCSYFGGKTPDNRPSVAEAGHLLTLSEKHPDFEVCAR